MLPIAIPITKLPAEGLISLRIGARHRSGLTSVLDVLIYHPRASNAGR
jgi:hypothetical protein